MQRGLVHLLSVIVVSLFALAPEIAAAQMKEATCAIPAGVKENVEKQVREYSAWLQSAKSAEDKAKAYNNRANAYFVLRRFDLAIKDREAERALTGKVLCQRCLAQAYLANGQYDRAISELTEVHERRKPGQYSYICFRGMAYHKKGDYDRAIKDYEEAMLDADDFKTCGLYGRGLAKLAKGDVAGGQADIDAANAADARAKYPTQYAYFFCMHGLTGSAKASGTSSPDGALAGWIATMKKYDVPEAAPHFLAAALCDGCDVAGIYCKRPLQSVSDLRGRKVVVTGNDRDFGKQVSSAGASAVFIPNGEIANGLELGVFDCAVGRR